MRAETMMQEYQNMKKELTILKFQLGQFKGASEEDVILSMQLSHPNGDEKVQTSILSDKTAKVAMNYRQIIERENDEWFNFLWERHRKVNEEMNFFEESVRNLSGILPIFIMKMVSGESTWDDLAAEYDISRRSVGNYKKKAIAELNKAYQLREGCVQEFILS
jgi:hypothetical protein